MCPCTLFRAGTFGVFVGGGDPHLQLICIQPLREPDRLEPEAEAGGGGSGVT